MYTLLSIVGVAVFLLLWELASDTGIVNSRYIAPPSKIVKLFFTKLTDPNPDGAVLGVNILASLQVSLTGFALAVLIGVPLGLLMGWYRGFDSFVRPIFEIVRPIPPVSWIPLTIVWMGIGLQAKAFIVFVRHQQLYGHPTDESRAHQLCQDLRRIQFHHLFEDWHPVLADDGVRRRARGAGQRVGNAGCG